MKVIGLTGGIGSGKTTVGQIFEMLGIPIYNSDDRAKILMEQNEVIIKSLVQHFGSSVYFANGTLNRKYLSKIIFANDSNLQWINAVVHPIVALDFASWKSKQSSIFVIKESAILIETLKQQLVDRIIVVSASKELRLARVMSRDDLSASDILKIMDKQIEDERRIMHADYVIENDGKLSLIKQTREIYQKLINLD